MGPSSPAAQCCVGPPGDWSGTTSNAFVESFNSRLRDECLNEHVFLTLAEARETIEAWRYDYNHLRPHGSLGALTPAEFAVLKGQEVRPPQRVKADVLPI